MSKEIKSIIEEFINSSSRYSRYNKVDYESVFGTKERRSAYSLIKLISESYNCEKYCLEDVKDEMEFFMRDSVSMNGRNKGTAIEIYKEFIKYIDDNYNINIKVNFPPIDSWISLERQLYIAKKMHEEIFNITDLSNELWVSTRTLEDDLARLKGRTNDPLQVLGQKLEIDFERRSNEITSPSTIHPLFLTQNLTQVIALLEGLNNQRQDEIFEKYAEKTAFAIWSQLSDYARKRIIFILDSLGKNTDWYKYLGEQLSLVSDSKLFNSEVECSDNEGEHNILDFLKNGKNFHIKYKNEYEENKLLFDCKIVKYDSKNMKFIIKTKDKEISISKNQIIKTSECKRDLS